MIMDDFEIERDYRHAKNKVSQIQILADMNMCSKKEMTDFLRKHGINISTSKTGIDARKSIIKLHTQGKTDEEIAYSIGYKLSSVSAIRARLGLKKHKKRKPAKADLLKSTV